MILGRILLLLIVCCGCNLAPPYEPPVVDTPEDWKNDACVAIEEQPCEPPVDYWWEVFQDPCLNVLEEEAIANSPDIYIALEKVVQARALAGVDKAKLFPKLTLDPLYSSTGLLLQIPPIPGLPIPPSLKTFREHQMQYVLPLDLSYEIDLWGKVRNQYTAAYFSAEAQAELFHATLLTLTSNLAISYFQLRSFDAQIQYLKDSIEVRRKNLELNESRYKKGISNDINVTQARADLANAEAAYYNTVRQRGLAENMIAVFLGRPASCFSLEENPLVFPPPCVPAGIPSEILLQRPDLAAAERKVASENAMIGVANAAFYPSFNLTGALGYLSPFLDDFLKWKSRYWSIGVNGSQSIFEGGRNCANLELAWARFREADDEYQQKVLTAFQEVEDALVNLEMLEKQEQWLTIAAEASNKSTGLSENRFQKGIINYQEVINNQNTALQADLNRLQVLGERYVSTVQLIRALGGCW